MSTNPYSAYLESSILSAPPLQLVHLAYRATIDAVNEARRHLAEKKIQERAKAITKAQLILMELARTLDFERGGDVSKRLSSLYDYMLKKLIEANFKQIEEPLTEVLQLLETLDEAWKELATPESAIATAANVATANPWASPMDAPARLSYSL